MRQLKCGRHLLNTIHFTESSRIVLFKFIQYSNERCLRTVTASISTNNTVHNTKNVFGQSNERCIKAKHTFHLNILHSPNYKSSPIFYSTTKLYPQTTVCQSIKAIIPQLTPVHELPHPGQSYPSPDALL